MSHHIGTSVAPDMTARVWDDYLRRFGPAAYVAARYTDASDLLPPLPDPDRQEWNSSARPDRRSAPATGAEELAGPAGVSG
jgi:hypothetical protein